MKRKILIEKSKNKIRTYLIEDDDIVEIHTSINEEQVPPGKLGDIYIGKVQNIVQNIGAAFIEITKGVNCYFDLKDAENAGEPFDLIITDMHFPMRSGAISDTEAGEKLVQILQEKGNQTNIIVCSTRNMKLPGVYGCIWYSEISDWEEELCDLVREMEKSK